MSRIGIMGGTFNPIHIGHLMLAECAREEYSLQEVWLIPTGCSYLKEEQTKREQGMPTPEERLQMTELSVGDVPGFSCLDIEVKRAGNTYTYETLEELKRKFPEEEFYFILGTDCLDAMENWKCPERIFANCSVIAAVRGDASLAAMEEKVNELRRRFGAKILLLPFRNLQLSSTEIRERVKQGKSIRYMVPETVRVYMENKGFYRG